jgi:hypothetical protein
MARVISTNGRKKISTLKKEFKEKFPHLELGVFWLEDRGKSSWRYVNGDLTLSEVRTKKGSGEISFSGNKNVRTIETEFLEKLGMFVDIGFKYDERNGSGSSITSTNDLTLSEYNIYAQKCIEKWRQKKN